MTDVIHELKDGRIIHRYINDGCPAIVYIREGGTVKVKRANLEYERELLNIISQIK